ncbi:carboxypeptidase-like regulatory domain-containing protein [Paenibacillus wulumuqiensis]|uniref:carboxypeptidase-like regulatory domain-containing protein n=1 Tax=Paenibacillus wulumuqiensis TaxID=1567107 RepID=UPI00061909A3|nr:carboxypeptidase-like regulatory domain-containing protein [Paenibacillus wulumuqiensis]
MKFRIKVKHLVLYGLLPLLLIGAGVYALMQPQVSGWLYGNKDLSPEQQRTELLAKLQKASTVERLSIIRDEVTGIEEYTPFYFDVYIGANNSQFSSPPESGPVLEPQEHAALLTEYITGGQPDYRMAEAVRELVFLYDLLGEQDKANQLLRQASQRFIKGTDEHRQLTVLQFDRLMNQGHLQQAQAVYDAENWNTSDEQLSDRTRLQARLLLAQGKSKQAAEALTRGIAEYRDYSGLNDSQIEENNGLIGLKRSIQTAIRQGDARTGTVSGTFRHSDGTPVRGAAVFLREESKLNHYSSDASDSAPYQAITDQEGRYTFHYVTPGTYQFRLGMSYEQVDGWTLQDQQDKWIRINQGNQLQRDLTLQPLIQLKEPVNDRMIKGNQVDFRWQPVKGAAYYALEGGIQLKDGSSRSAIRSHIKENHISISIEELYGTMGALSYRETGDFQSLKPEYVLYFMNPEARLLWNVQAFTEDGQLITQSIGYRLTPESMGNLPFFYLQNRTLTEADRILLQHQPEQALAAYRQDLTANPADEHALLMIIRLLDAKTSITNDHRYEDEAITLLRKVPASKLSIAHLDRLTDYYYRKQNWPLYNQYHALYMKTSPADSSAYIRSTYATALMYQGKWEDAEKQFAAAMKQDQDHRFIGNYIALRMYKARSLSAGVELARQYPEHTDSNDRRDWAQLLANVQSERKQAQNPESYDQQLWQKLGWYIHGDQDRLKKESKPPTGEPAMNKLLQALQQVS